MKTLDRRAAEIFRKMLALQTTKIDNSDGTYMPVHIELIGRIDKYDFFRWLITDSRTEMPCAIPKCYLPYTMKHGNSFPITIATTIAVSRKTASDGRKME